MRRALVVACLLVVCGALAAPAWAEGPVPDLDTSTIEQFLKELSSEFGEYAPDIDLKAFLAQLTQGGTRYDVAGLWQGLWRYLLRELLSNANLLGRLLVMAVFCALLQNLHSAFEGDTVGRLAYGVCHLALALLAFSGLRLALSVARGVVEQLVSFMQAMVPLLLTLVAASGALTSAGLFHPLMVAVVYGVSSLVKDVVLPLIFLAAVLDIVGGFAEGIKVSHLSGLLRQAGMVLMGILMCTFLGVSAAQGAAGAVADGVSLRSAKFLAATFVPVVGKMFADATELVFGGSLLLKNALGAAGALAILVATAFPLLKLAAMVITYRLAAAIVQPAGGERIGDCLNAIASSLSLILAGALGVSVMFFLALTMVISAGNAAMMLR